MALRKQRGASPPPPSTAQYKRLLNVTEHLTAMVQQLSDQMATAQSERNIQFKRIAQIQIEIDAIKQSLAKLTGHV